MERKEVLEKLNDIFDDILDLGGVTVTDSTTAYDIEEWDSLAHIQLVVAIEKAFGIKFTSKEVVSWKNVGEMVDSILKK